MKTENLLNEGKRDEAKWYGQMAINSLITSDENNIHFMKQIFKYLKQSHVINPERIIQRLFREFSDEMVLDNGIFNILGGSTADNDISVIINSGVRMSVFDYLSDIRLEANVAKRESEYFDDVIHGWRNNEDQEVVDKFNRLQRNYNFLKNIPSDITGDGAMLSENSFIDDLKAKKGKPILFETYRNAGQKYQIGIQSDFISQTLRLSGEKEPLMFYVKSVAKEEDEMEYPVGMVTGLDVDENNIVQMGWIVVLDYKKLFEELKAFREKQDQRRSYLDTMTNYFLFNPNDELGLQIKLLYGYITSILKLKNDTDVEEFFNTASEILPSENLKGQGIADAMFEFLNSFIPLGSQIKITLQNEKYLAQWGEAGVKFEDTTMAKVLQRNGYDLVRTDEVEGKLPGYILKKNRLVKPKTPWFDSQVLGQHIDKAMISDVGGIDFNPDLLDLESHGEAIEFNLPEEFKYLETTPINGFSPVIFQIIPVTNLPLLLGGKGGEGNAPLAQVLPEPLAVLRK